MAFKTGTILHGTFRDQDMLEAFSNAYKQYCEHDKDYSTSLYLDAKMWASLVEREFDNLGPLQWDAIDSVLDGLMNRLESLAAKHDCYFGCTEGDGSEFGFWPNVGGIVDADTGEYLRYLYNKSPDFSQFKSVRHWEDNE
jgi:hypothetical protein